MFYFFSLVPSFILISCRGGWLFDINISCSYTVFGSVDKMRSDGFMIDI